MYVSVNNKHHSTQQKNTKNISNPRSTRDPLKKTWHKKKNIPKPVQSCLFHLRQHRRSIIDGGTLAAGAGTNEETGTRRKLQSDWSSNAWRVGKSLLSETGFVSDTPCCILQCYVSLYNIVVVLLYTIRYTVFVMHFRLPTFWPLSCTTQHLPGKILVMWRTRTSSSFPRWPQLIRCQNPGIWRVFVPSASSASSCSCRRKSSRSKGFKVTWPHGRRCLIGFW